MTQTQTQQTIETQLDSLCSLLDVELRRQQQVLALSRAQGEAVRHQDRPSLEQKSQELAAVLDEAIHAERRRLRLLDAIVAHYRLPVEQQTLSFLIATVPAPWSERLRTFQVEVKAVLAEVRQVVEDNQRAMRHSLRIVNNALQGLTNAADSGYNAEGRQSGTARPAACRVAVNC